jgi:23S rRNA (adenine2030-N6)-methyltransferase
MNYRHGYHAGNFADVVKHIALVAVLQHLKKKDVAFAVIDTHAGRGVYDLSGEHAARTGEAQNGIARLRDLSGALPQALSAYLDLAAGDVYPGSPLVAAKLLRPQDRLTAIEKHPQEYAILKDTLDPYRVAACENLDGYARLPKLLPPPARRGLVVIDPPFEAPDEFKTLARTLVGALRKFATGIYLVWYPIKSQAAADAFTSEVLAGGAAKALTIDVKIAAPEGKLDRAGLLVLNPPYGFDAAMAAAAAVIAPAMQAEIAIAWLAGED